jgi:hypothetical protein
MVRDVKMHAAERGLSLRQLFEEMWPDYLKTHREARK